MSGRRLCQMNQKQDNRYGGITRNFNGVINRNESRPRRNEELSESYRRGTGDSHKSCIRRNESSSRGNEGEHNEYATEDGCTTESRNESRSRGNIDGHDDCITEDKR